MLQYLLLYVLFPVGRLGHTHVPAQGLAPAPGTVVPGHAVAHAAGLALVLQRTGHLETDLGIMIGHQRTDQDPGIEVLRTGPVQGTMDARVHPRTTLKAVLTPGLGQGAGKSCVWERNVVHLCSLKKWIKQEFGIIFVCLPFLLFLITV